VYKCARVTWSCSFRHHNDDNNDDDNDDDDDDDDDDDRDDNNMLYSPRSHDLIWSKVVFNEFIIAELVEPPS